jgi:hypothetical protein
MGRKVSHEFTVPLCRTHYRDNHRFGDEATWWGRQAIDPVGTSRKLWVSTRRIEKATVRLDARSEAKNGCGVDQFLRAP